jgi:hypothetical protein
MGYLAEMTEDEKRAEFIERLVEADGNILLTAFNMGYTRRWVYNAVERFELWPLVNRLRLNKIERRAMEKKHGVSGERVTDD